MPATIPVPVSDMTDLADAEAELLAEFEASLSDTVEEEYAVVDAAAATEVQKAEHDAVVAEAAAVEANRIGALALAAKTAAAAAKFAKQRRVQYEMACDQQCGIDECVDAEDNGPLEHLDWDEVCGERDQAEDEPVTKETTGPPKLHRSQYKTYKTKKELILAMVGKDQKIIIQASHGTICRYRLYSSHDGLNTMADYLKKGHHVREVIDRSRMVLAFADIDSKFTPLPDMIAAFDAAFGTSGRTRSFETTKGYHLVAAPGNWVSLKDHYEGLCRMYAGTETHPSVHNVDTMAVHTLRLAGTSTEYGGPPKSMSGLTMSETLVQPLGAPADPGYKTATAVENGTYTPEEIEAGIAALTVLPNVFHEHGIHGNKVQLSRVATAMCLCCDRIHDSLGASLTFYSGDDHGTARCYASGSKPRKFKRPGYITSSIVRFSGHFEPKVTARRYHQVGGCRDAPRGDYIEGSPCGLGKSKACWASIEDGQSVLFVSYRKSLSRSQGALNGCENYADIRGEIQAEPGRRVVCQFESLHRIRGTFDVLILDEVHGMMRQACGNPEMQSKPWKALVEAIKNAKRFVGLDAEANDKDAAILGMIRGTKIPLYINTFKPHTNKKVFAYVDPKVFDLALTEHIEIHQGLTTEERLANKFIIVCHWRKDVRLMHQRLAAAGIKAKAYHGKMSEVDRTRDFSDPELAWADVSCVVYNMCLEAGVSIEGPEWKTAFCQFKGMGAVEASMQAIHRFRAIETYHTSAVTANWGGNFPTNEEALIDAIHAGNRAIVTKQDNRAVKGKTTQSVKPKLVRPSFDAFMLEYVKSGMEIAQQAQARMWLSIKLEENRSAVHWPGRFYTMLESTGFKVEPVSEMVLKKPSKKVVVTEARIAECTIFKGTEAEQIAAVNVNIYLDALREETCTGGEFTRDKTQDEIDGETKFKIMQEYKMEPDAVEGSDAEWIETFGRESILAAHHNIAALAKLETPTYSAAIKLADTLDRAKTGIRLQTHSEVQCNNAIADVLAVLGLNELNSREEIRPAKLKSILTATPPPAIKFLYDNSARLYGVGGRKRKGQKDPHDVKTHLLALNAIFKSHYGVKLIADVKDGPYSLHHMSWPDDILSVWNGRRVVAVDVQAEVYEA